MPTEQRVAVVTGAARGIGSAIARKLASDGCSVALFDLDPCEQVAAEISASGAETLGLKVDVADEEQVEHAMASVSERLGPPVVLVNNAGIIRDSLLFRMSASDWDNVMAVHLRGAFLMARAAQRSMTEVGWGRIINLSSVSALGNRGQANYAAAKAGVQGFTKTVAIELGPFGVTCNAIAPGFIATDMTEATASRIGIPFEEFKAGAAAEIPVRRVGEPEDIAATASFLASEEAGFVSGQVIYVGGGPFD